MKKPNNRLDNKLFKINVLKKQVLQLNTSNHRLANKNNLLKTC